MDVGNAIDGQPFVFGKHFGPELAIAGKSPIVLVEPAPQHGAAVLIQILLGCYPVVEALDIHNADGVVGLTVDGNGITAHNVHDLLGSTAGNSVSVTVQKTLWGEMDFVSAVILSETPVFQKAVSIQEGVEFSNAVFHVAFRQVTAMGIGELGYESAFHLIHRTGPVVILRIVLDGGYLHPFDAVDLGFAKDLHFGILGAGAGGCII